MVPVVVPVIIIIAPDMEVLSSEFKICPFTSINLTVSSSSSVSDFTGKDLFFVLQLRIENKKINKKSLFITNKT
jgi:hypothetical protein